MKTYSIQCLLDVPFDVDLKWKGKKLPSEEDIFDHLYEALNKADIDGDLDKYSVRVFDEDGDEIYNAAYPD